MGEIVALRRFGELAKKLPMTCSQPLENLVTSSKLGVALSEEQAQEAADLTMTVVAATETGNIVQIIGAANKLAAFSEQSKSQNQGFGLVDVAGVVDAVQDLVAAASI